MHTIFNREEEAEQVISRILKSPEACERLRNVFYEYLDDDHVNVDLDSKRFAKVFFSAYENRDISALLLEICGKSTFDLLREAYLVPKHFHGKGGKNPVFLTDKEGEILPNVRPVVSKHEYDKFKEILKKHKNAPRSALYLVDGYDMRHSYNDKLEVKTIKVNRKRGILVLYALPDTISQGMTEAQAYSIIWESFMRIQDVAPTAIVYYGQETGLRKEKKYDEIGILLPMHQFEKSILNNIEEIDGIVLACREEMMRQAGNDSLDL